MSKHTKPAASVRADEPATQGPTGPAPAAMPVLAAADLVGRHAHVSGPGPAQANGWWVGSNEDPDRYELLGVGVSGGEGTTFEALYHGEEGTRPIRVAVKQLHRPHGVSPTWPHPQDWTRWQDQIHIIHQVSSPHLIQVRTIIAGAPPHHRGTVPAVTDEIRYEVPYLIMEWISGTTLHQRVRSASNARDARQRIGWIAQLAEAVSALHSATRTAGNPMVHRDVKPANCMIDINDRLVLIDIGSLRHRDAKHDVRGMYSRRYTAPEVLHDLHGPRGPASDVYSLGAVAYFCLTRQDPPEAGQLTERQIRTAIDGPRRWRRRLARHLMQALAPDSDVRAAVRPDAWAQQLLRITVRRRRWPAVAMGVVSAVIAAVVALYATGVLTVESVAVAPAGTTQSTAAMKPFGHTFQQFPFVAGNDTVVIDPPANYQHLWGGFLPAQRCATTVEFLVAMNGEPHLPAYGLAVAPRATLDGDQPQGASIQYEYEPSEIAREPGTYVRPATLPGGAWSITVRPAPAPDIRKPHRVRVYAVGSSMAIDLDGRQVAEYELTDVECGGVAVRAWGARFTLTGISVHGT